jgi:hypothetical protein
LASRCLLESYGAALEVAKSYIAFSFVIVHLPCGAR